LSKRKLMVALSIGLILAMTRPVLADPNNSPSNPTLTFEQQQQFAKEESIEKLDNDIQTLLVQIEIQNNELNQKQEEVNIQTDKLNDLTDRLAAQKVLFSTRARALYIMGEVNYLSVLFNSESMSDLISRIDSVKRIMDFDNKTFNGIKETMEEAEKLQDSLMRENNNLLSLKKENEAKLNDLHTKKDTEVSILAQIKAEIEAENIRQAQERARTLEENFVYTVQDTDSQDIKDMLLAIQVRKTNNPIASRGNKASGNDLVDYASDFLGIPYLWGGITPNGFDCSGFVQYVYAHYGIKINRTTYEQVKQGETVSNGQLQPGDLLFFGGSDIHHVGMYIGNGLYIHAPRTGDVIKISSLSARNDFTIAKRFIK
jgi:cell wall-associated NlpC family hydrolase